MGPVVIIVILPLSELFVKQVNVIGDAVLVEELVELLVVDPVRPLDLAVGRSRALHRVMRISHKFLRSRIRSIRFTGRHSSC